MEAVFEHLIRQLNSSVFVLLVILAAFCWGIYKIGGWAAVFKHHEEKITKIEGLADRVLVMQTKVDLIYQNTLGAKSPIASFSPINLTPVGVEIATKINAETILSKYLSNLMKQIELDSCKNAYDIQMTAMKLAKEKLLTFLDSQELATVKQEAYNRGLTVEDIMSVFGVLLRDHILKEKGYAVADVDKHAPPPPPKI